MTDLTNRERLEALYKKLSKTEVGDMDAVRAALTELQSIEAATVSSTPPCHVLVGEAVAYASDYLKQKTISDLARVRGSLLQRINVARGICKD